MASEKRGGRRKIWYEQYYPVDSGNPPPYGAVLHSKFKVYVIKHSKPKKAKCKVANPGLWDTPGQEHPKAI